MIKPSICACSIVEEYQEVESTADERKDGDDLSTRSIEGNDNRFD